MTGQKVWTRHYQAEWEIRSGDPRLPKWFRVTSLAYGMHRANGHAQFARGQIGLVLASVDQATGEIVPDPNVGRSIRTAVEFGFLSPLSNSRCLVVPAHAIEGPHGNPHAVCPMHGGQL